MTRAIVALIGAAGGCYVEAGIGVGRATGPDLDDRWGWVVSINAGADFASSDHRVLVGTAAEWSSTASVAPQAAGLSVGGDVRVGGSDARQVRLAGRLTPLSLATVDIPANPNEGGYAVPVFVGVSVALDCDQSVYCTHVSVGSDVIVFHRDEVGWGALIAPQVRISSTSGFLTRVRDANRQVR